MAAEQKRHEHLAEVIDLAEIDDDAVGHVFTQRLDDDARGLLASVSYGGQPIASYARSTAGARKLLANESPSRGSLPANFSFHSARVTRLLVSSSVAPAAA